MVADRELLDRYCRSGCAQSFETLVRRHSDWVHSVCARHLGGGHLADDATQAVFILLARKASTITEKTSITGWLFKVSRFAAADARRREQRYRKRVERAAELSPATSTDLQHCEQLAPLLDEAVAALPEAHRQTVLLRFYENKSLAEVALTLGISEEAAKKRTTRAVAKLREYFQRRGAIVSAALLLTFLAASAASACPLATAEIAAAATGSSEAGGQALMIAHGASKAMTHAAARLLAALVAAVVALLLALSPVVGAIARPLIDSLSPPPPAVVAYDAAPAPIESETPSAAAESRGVDALWVSSGGEITWRYSPPISGSIATLNEIHDLRSATSPLVVAQDHAGQFWLREIAPDHVLAGPGNHLDDYYTPPPPVDREALIRSLLNDVGDGFSGPTPPPGWHRMQAPDEDGTLVIRQMLDRMLPNSFEYGPTSVPVPEPAALAVIVIGAALLVRRRR